MFYYFDPTMLLIVPALLLAFYAQFKVRSAYEKYSKVAAQSGMTAAEAAQAMLRAGGIEHVRIERVAGNLTDHYDPRDEVLRLSQGVYDSASLSAIGIAAHEVGHAMQARDAFAPLHLRSALVPAANIGSYAAVPLFVLGMVLSWQPLMWVGIGAFALAVVFYLVTLPVEFNASGRAIEMLETTGILTYEEARPARSVLNAAALTYVASALMAVGQLLRLLVLSGAGRRRD